MNLFENTLKLNGFPISKAKSLLKEIQQIPENKYDNYIINAREKIVTYHIQNNPFYRKLIGSKNYSWEDIPVMTKSDLQQPLENRLSKGFNQKNIYINKTSGSSGTPFVFAKDKFCHALTWAKIIDSFGSLGIDFNSSLQARFYGIPLNPKGYYKERIKDYFSNRYRFPVFDLSEEKLNKVLNKFETKKFNYINGYTSSIVLFAKFLKGKNIILNQVCPTLEYCIVTSEMLFNDDKALMEATFGVPVINEYGASELDLIAFTDYQDEFIVNSETLFVEILDENNQTVPHGSSGRIVITSLYNKAQPMIRYDIGDIGILSKASTYKKPVLEKLIGRTNDLITLPSGKTLAGLTFYYVTKSIVSDNGNVKEFMIEQTKIDTFKIKYVSNRELFPKEKTKIEKAIIRYLENDLTIVFEREKSLKRSKSGKLKQFVSMVKQ
ncbi:phenylacetate--CoA ligase family protein [Aequorivita sp. KMM 9714]|uniref:phenylacetate--CoA ligase family protein n=1 Tax=Aequorivita sp. KMM 9714 TaxID=2707173 RepID=UPI0013EBEF21|nr:phenylacetate--CoA ligase family protein [Aequorivita sp. KMM 9714]NGX83061.1 phenylacetate--CoA ligase family protein [Aequorivita sp. KMM 9714]